MNNIPPGLKFLQGERQPEEDTVNALNECCEARPDGCEYIRECQKLYTTRCGRNPQDGGWKWPFKSVHRDPAIRYQPDIIRYCDYLQTIPRRVIRDRIRESVIGGMR